MFSTDIQVKCPVGNNILGYRSKKELSTFLCKDCGFLYTWGSNGKLLPPVKYEKKKEPETCDCSSCNYRDGL